MSRESPNKEKGWRREGAPSKKSIAGWDRHLPQPPTSLVPELKNKKLMASVLLRKVPR